jgi:hypothetical protein
LWRRRKAVDYRAIKDAKASGIGDWMWNEDVARYRVINDTLHDEKLGKQNLYIIILWLWESFFFFFFKACPLDILSSPFIKTICLDLQSVESSLN